jgi:hypothetical protein
LQTRLARHPLLVLILADKVAYFLSDADKYVGVEHLKPASTRSVSDLFERRQPRIIKAVRVGDPRVYLS